MADDPTIYEWGGGREAFSRWLNAFYDLVEQDAEIAALFGGTVSAEHRDHVTDWWCEVMGGPAAYTDHRGGYEHMLAMHRGLSITPDMRLRFVTLAQPRRRRGRPPGRPGVPRRADGLRGVGLAAGGPQLPARGRGRRTRSGPALGLGRRAAVPAVAAGRRARPS